MSKFVEELKKDIEGIEARHEQKKEIRHERHEEKKFASYVTGCDGSAPHTGISTSGSQAGHG